MATLDLPGVMHLGDVQAHMADGPNQTLLLDLNAAAADCALLGWRHVPLAMHGSLQRDAQARWIFDGTLQLQANASAAWSNATMHLLADQAANNVELALQQGESRFDVSLPMDQSSHLQIKLDNVPVSWLQGLAASVWAGQLKAGRLSAALAVDVLEQGLSTTGEFDMSRVTFASRSGRLAGDWINGGGRIALQSNSSSADLQLDVNLHGGTLHLDSFDARFPDHSVQLALQANLALGKGNLTHVQFEDPDALHFGGSFAVDAQGRLRSIRLDQFNARLPAAYQRYAQTWLAVSSGFRDLHATGQISGSASVQDGLLQALILRSDGLDLADVDGRLAIEQLRGGLDWAAHGNRSATTLAWNGMRIYRIVLGAAQGQWQSQHGSLALLHPLSMPVLGGSLRLRTLAWQPNASSRELSGALDLAGLDVEQVSRLMGWPAIAGTLDGSLPALRWTGDRMDMDGGLSLHVFDGSIDVTHLSWQRPFGENMQLSGDVRLKQLDLTALTDVFTIGNISGRLDGEVNGLHLLNGSPVAFNASLRAGGGKISQRAVNSVTSIGGSGMASGLQAAVLRLFKNFSYRRLGINCVLKDAICQMSGLHGNADGYTILEGSGFPRLQIVGHQQRVDWLILMRRLKAAVSGNPASAR